MTMMHEFTAIVPDCALKTGPQAAEVDDKTRPSCSCWFLFLMWITLTCLIAARNGLSVSYHRSHFFAAFWRHRQFYS